MFPSIKVQRAFVRDIVSCRDEALVEADNSDKNWHFEAMVFVHEATAFESGDKLKENLA